MRQIAAPTAEPLTLDQVRIHLRQMADGDSPGASPAFIEEVPDDSWVGAKITAARQWAEDFLGVPLTDATYVETFAAWADPLQLAVGTSEVVAVRYLDVDNALQTLGPSAYEYDPLNEALYIDADWPAVSKRAGAVRVEFRGSYFPADPGASPQIPASAVPENIKHALLLMIGHWYENREAAVVGAAVSELPLAVEALLRPQRVRLGMA